MTLGLSLSNYYENALDSSLPSGYNDTFGFFAIGAAVSVPLNMPAAYGSWEVTGALHLLSLGGYLEALNDGDQVQVIGSFGVSIATPSDRRPLRYRARKTVSRTRAS